MSCLAIDTVLASSFEHAQLLEMFPELERDMIELQSNCRMHLEPDQLIYGMAHKACHDDGRISRRVHAVLNQRHREAIHAVRVASPQAVLEMCAAYAHDAARLPGMLWALLTDPREDLRRYLPAIVQGVMLRSIRNWMETFGPPSWAADTGTDPDA